MLADKLVDILAWLRHMPEVYLHSLKSIPQTNYVYYFSYEDNLSCLRKQIHASARTCDPSITNQVLQPLDRSPLNSIFHQLVYLYLYLQRCLERFEAKISTGLFSDHTEIKQGRNHLLDLLDIILSQTHVWFILHMFLFLNLKRSKIKRNYSNNFKAISCFIETRGSPGKAKGLSKVDPVITSYSRERQRRNINVLKLFAGG